MNFTIEHGTRGVEVDLRVYRRKRMRIAIDRGDTMTDEDLEGELGPRVARAIMTVLKNMSRTMESQRIREVKHETVDRTLRSNV